MRVSSLSTTALLSGLALAQNATDSKTCTNQWTLDQVSTGRINSTGSESFTWNSDTARDQGVTDPWFVSVTVNETLPGSEGASSLSNGGTIAWAYLSVPESARDVSVCAYQFKPRNATSSGNGGTNDVGCGGVLSDRCTTYLREALLNQTSGGYQSTLRCGSLPNSERERREEACGPLESIASTGYQNLTNSTCTYPSLSGVSLPQNYTTQNMLSSLNPFDASLDTSWANYSARAYDLLVVQSMPVAIVATFGSGVGGTRSLGFGRDVKFVCVTPNNTQPGSRVPESKTPWESKGVRGSISGTWSAVLAGVVGLVLAL